MSMTPENVELWLKEVRIGELLEASMAEQAAAHIAGEVWVISHKVAYLLDKISSVIRDEPE
jgi:hypothetical protein